jgi:GH25 family lysozyme M1 (1,4-beta-N-acetylmuramidase)
MAKLKGIDVSAWQGSIDWDKVKSQIDFAILRVGYGSDLTKQDDKTFKQNADACTRLGIPFGVYIYSYANNTVKAKSEAKHVLRLIKGYKLDYPVYYDLEDEATTGKCTKSTILAIAKTFENAISKAGYKVGFYANKYWWTTKLTDSYYNGFSKWVAQYNTECTYNGKYDIWQYSDKGSVKGIKGNVDMNYCYKTFVQKKELAVGDKVKITGAYASSAYSEEAINTKAKGRTAYITKIYAGTKYPYQLGAKKGDVSSENTIGFTNKSGIKNA